ncbi:MAG: transcription elongation factor GreAB [Mariprofundus sp.]|nr:transcription elongation factor GreAB [Mariprofundus sp.]
MRHDKNKILACIIAQLEADLLMLEQAVKLARDTATHADCLGSSKYETMGLEASYLAQGQGMRLLEVERSLAYFKALSLVETDGVVVLSALVELENEQGQQQLLWLAAEAGGLKLRCGESIVTVITPKAPLGTALMGKLAQDDFEISIAGIKHSYEVIAIY